MESKPYILLVEDNEDDIDLTVRALKKQAAIPVMVFRDGTEVLEYLEAHLEEALPALILLDLKLPKMDGIEVLRHLRAQPRTEKVPVVMLTSSSRKADLDAAYAAGANSYLVKAVDFKQFTRDVEQLASYWLGLNRI